MRFGAVFPLVVLSLACAQREQAFVITVEGRGSIRYGDQVCTGECSWTWAGTSRLIAQPADGNQFLGWSDACVETRTCVARQPVIARFSNRALLRLEASGEGTLVLETATQRKEQLAPLEAWLEVGEPVVVEGMPNAGWAFARWAVACGASPRCAFSMTAEDLILDALFSPVAHLSVRGPGVIETSVGTTCAAECDVAIPSDVPLALRAVPSGQAEVVSFDPLCPNPCIISAQNGPVTWMARFRPVVTVDFVGDGAGAITSRASLPCASGPCRYPLEPGSSIALTAQPGDDSTFRGWSSSCTQPQLGTRCELDGGAVVQANFENKVASLIPLTQFTWATLLDCGGAPIVVGIDATDPNTIRAHDLKARSIHTWSPSLAPQAIDCDGDSLVFQFNHANGQRVLGTTLPPRATGSDVVVAWTSIADGGVTDVASMGGVGLDTGSSVALTTTGSVALAATLGGPWSTYDAGTVVVLLERDGGVTRSLHLGNASNVLAATGPGATAFAGGYLGQSPVLCGASSFTPAAAPFALLLDSNWQCVRAEFGRSTAGAVVRSVTPRLSAEGALGLVVSSNGAVTFGGATSVDSSESTFIGRFDVNGLLAQRLVPVSGCRSAGLESVTGQRLAHGPGGTVIVAANPSCSLAFDGGAIAGGTWGMSLLMGLRPQRDSFPQFFVRGLERGLMKDVFWHPPLGYSLASSTRPLTFGTRTITTSAPILVEIRATP